MNTWLIWTLMSEKSYKTSSLKQSLPLSYDAVLSASCWFMMTIHLVMLCCAVCKLLVHDDPPPCDTVLCCLQVSSALICQICHKTFSRGTNLRRHIQEVHLQIKKYLCPICGRPFAQQGTLDAHIIAIHKTEKPYHCSQCTMAFTTEGEKKRHWKAMHWKLEWEWTYL